MRPTPDPRPRRPGACDGLRGSNAVFLRFQTRRANPSLALLREPRAQCRLPLPGNHLQRTPSARVTSGHRLPPRLANQRPEWLSRGRRAGPGGAGLAEPAAGRPAPSPGRRRGGRGGQAELTAAPLQHRPLSAAALASSAGKRRDPRAWRVVPDPGGAGSGPDQPREGLRPAFCEPGAALHTTVPNG